MNEIGSRDHGCGAFIEVGDKITLVPSRNADPLVATKSANPKRPWEIRSKQCSGFFWKLKSNIARTNLIGGKSKIGIILFCYKLLFILNSLFSLHKSSW